MLRERKDILSESKHADRQEMLSCCLICTHKSVALARVFSKSRTWTSTSLSSIPLRGNGRENRLFRCASPTSEVDHSSSPVGQLCPLPAFRIWLLIDDLVLVWSNCCRYREARLVKHALSLNLPFNIRPRKTCRLMLCIMPRAA
jgi:hypothetical protein